MTRLGAFAVLAATVSFASGCSISGAAGTSSREESVRAYVAAINAQDGEAVCDLLTPEGSYEFVDWLAEEAYVDESSCPRFVSLLIGYGEEADTDTFHEARIVEVEDGERVGDVRSVKMQIELELAEQGNERDRITKTFDDVAWLVERDGRWLLAKPSGVLLASFAAYTVPDDLLEAPDPEAQMRDRERKIAAERKREEAERKTFAEPSASVLKCGGRQTSQEDLGGDATVQGGIGFSAVDVAQRRIADFQRVEVDTLGDDLCVRITMHGGEIGDLLTILFEIYSPKKSPYSLSSSLDLQLDVRADGEARFGYEDDRQEDEYGRARFIPVPSEIARENDTFSFRVARSDLPDATRLGSVPDWDGFLWGGLTFNRVEIDGEPRLVTDYLHSDNASMTSHPGGKVFSVTKRQKRDLPTG